MDTSGEQLQGTNETSSIDGKADELVASNNVKPSETKIDTTHPSPSSSSSYQVIFSTPSKYDLLTKALLIIPPVVLFIEMVYLGVDNANDSSSDQSAVWILACVLIFAGLICLLFLPKQLDIRSNGSIGIKTTLVTYQFGDICHAHLTSFGRETSCAPLQFATCFSSQMVIRRRSGKCKVVISPLQAEEFLQTLQSVIPELEMEAEGRNSTVIMSSSKNNNDPETAVSNAAPVISLDDPPVVSEV